MAKIVYNACHGGFGLSDAAIKRYAELKGIKIYPEEGRFSLVTYWTCPPEARVGKIIASEDWYAHPVDERVASNKFCSDNQISDRNIKRTDPCLVQAVEELGEKANGQCARLAIEEIADGSPYRIDEYDGFESIETPQGQQWEVA